MADVLLASWPPKAIHHLQGNSTLSLGSVSAVSHCTQGVIRQAGAAAEAGTIQRTGEYVQGISVTTCDSILAVLHLAD
jgi:hypothetical protein